MNGQQLNTILSHVPSYVPIKVAQKSWNHNGSASIRLVRNNHWISIFKIGGQEFEFDSQPFQVSNTCGLFAVVAVLTFAAEGIGGVRALWASFQRGNVGEAEVIEAVREWMRRNE
ncbi:MAG: hypothetical protein GY820_24185 [Gammaproteobacteria bacterium]|nr:hypothetical protein [Gammaproteobacteria bacterium]